MALEGVVNNDFGKFPIAPSMGPMQLPDFTKASEWDLKTMELAGEPAKLKAKAEANAQKILEKERAENAKIPKFEGVDNALLQPFVTEKYDDWKRRKLELEKMTQSEDPIELVTNPEKMARIREARNILTQEAVELPIQYKSIADNLKSSQETLNKNTERSQDIYTASAVAASRLLRREKDVDPKAIHDAGGIYVPETNYTLISDRKPLTDIGRTVVGWDVKNEDISKAAMGVDGGIYIQTVGSKGKQVSNAAELAMAIAYTRDEWMTAPDMAPETAASFLRVVGGANNAYESMLKLNFALDKNGKVISLFSGSKSDIAQKMENAINNLGSSQTLAGAMGLTENEREKLKENILKIGNEDERKRRMDVFGLSDKKNIYKEWVNEKVTSLYLPKSINEKESGFSSTFAAAAKQKDGESGGDKSMIKDLGENVFTPNQTGTFGVFRDNDDEDKIGTYDVDIAVLTDQHRDALGKNHATKEQLTNKGITALGGKIPSDFLSQVNPNDIKATNQVWHIPATDGKVFEYISKDGTKLAKVDSQTGIGSVYDITPLDQPVPDGKGGWKVFNEKLIYALSGERMLDNKGDVPKNLNVSGIDFVTRTIPALKVEVGVKDRKSLRGLFWDSPEQISKGREVTLGGKTVYYYDFFSPIPESKAVLNSHLYSRHFDAFQSGKQINPEQGVVNLGN